MEVVGCLLTEDDPSIYFYRSRRAANEEQIAKVGPMGFYLFSIDKQDFPMKRRPDLEAVLPKEIESSLQLQESYV